MFVPDLMHEFELGVWKAVFTHLMRVLHTYGHDTISNLNSRSVVEVSYIFRSNPFVTGTVKFLHSVVQPFENFITMHRQ
jgi:hypothetical protein